MPNAIPHIVLRGIQTLGTACPPRRPPAFGSRAHEITVGSRARNTPLTAPRRTANTFSRGVRHHTPTRAAAAGRWRADSIDRELADEREHLEVPHDDIATRAA